MWFEVLHEAIAHRAVEPVRTDDQVGIGVGGRIRDIGLEPQFDTELLAAAAEDVEEDLPRDAAEAVPRRGEHFSLIVDVDVIPVGKASGDRFVARPVGLGQVLQCRIGKNHAKAEGVIAPVALDDRDLVARVSLLHQDREVEARRAAADAGDLHPALLPR